MNERGTWGLGFLLAVLALHWKAASFPGSCHIPLWLLRVLCWIKTGPGIGGVGVGMEGNEAVLLCFMALLP